MPSQIAEARFLIHKEHKCSPCRNFRSPDEGITPAKLATSTTQKPSWMLHMEGLLFCVFRQVKFTPARSSTENWETKRMAVGGPFLRARLVLIHKGSTQLAITDSRHLILFVFAYPIWQGRMGSRPTSYTKFLLLG